MPRNTATFFAQFNLPIFTAVILKMWFIAQQQLHQFWTHCKCKLLVSIRCIKSQILCLKPSSLCFNPMFAFILSPLFTQEIYSFEYPSFSCTVHLPPFTTAFAHFLFSYIKKVINTFLLQANFYTNCLYFFFSLFNLIKSVFHLHQALKLFLNLTHKAHISTRVIFSFLNYPVIICLFLPSEIIFF